MKQRLIESVLNAPWRVLLLALALVVVATMGAKNLVFKSDYRVFFSEQNEQLDAFERMQKVYSKSDNVAFVLSPKDGEIFTPKQLEAVYWLTEQAWQVPYSSRVDSISNYQHTYAEEDDLIVEDLVLDPDQLTSDQMAAMRQIATSEPQLLSKLISEKTHVSVVNVTVHLPGKNPVAEVPEVVTKVRAIRDAFSAQYPDIGVHLSGMVIMNNAFAESSQNDSATLIPAMFGVVVLTMIFLLRAFSGTFATIVIILFSIMSTMGLAGWTGFYLTGPSASAPTMILTLAVADCVHILSSFYYEMRHGVEKRKALVHSLQINFQPILITSATTAIGFMSMNFSDSPPFRDLGNMVAAGVMLAFVFSVTVFPALLTILPTKVRVREDADQPDIMDKLAEFVVNQRKFLLPFMMLVVISVTALLPKNTLNDDFVKYFDTSVPFRQATDYMQDNLSGMTTIEISIDSGEPSGINSPQYLQKVEQFSQWLRAQPETDHVSTITDTLKRLNRSMHGDDERYYVLPDSQELAAQYLLMYELSLPYGLDLNNQLNVKKSSTRVIGTFENMTSNQQIEMEARMLKWFADNASEYTVQIASPSLMFAHIGKRNIYSMLVGIGLALVLISVLLGFAMRSVRYGVISLLPNLAPAAMGFGVWYLIDGEVGLALSVVAGMTLGIVVDDTVHFLSKYQYARETLSKGSRDSVRYAFGNVGRALWITTMVLVAGFMVLAQSTFKVNADMGLLTAITIVIALVVDFLLLPPLLIALDGKPDSERAAATSKDAEPNPL